MTAQQIIEQIEKLFGRQPEQYVMQLVNDALNDIAANKRNYTVSSTTDLEGHKRWYEFPDKVIDITKVEVKDTNDRYVMIPKLSDPHKILREDTESSDDSLT